MKYFFYLNISYYYIGYLIIGPIDLTRQNQPPIPLLQKKAVGHHGIATALSHLLFWSHKQVCDVPLKYITLHQLQVHTYVWKFKIQT